LESGHLYRQFFRQFTGFSLFLALSVGILHYYFPDYVATYTWYILLFFVVITAITYMLIARGLDDPADFSNLTLAATGIRLFICAGVLFTYYYHVNDRGVRMQFTFTFFILYFLFTGFEIKTLLSNLRANQGKPDEKDGKI
jgi:hypothetical protein